MRRQPTVFKTVDDVIRAYFSRFQQETPSQPEELEPRLAGEMLARAIAEATKARVQEAIVEQQTS